MSHPEEYTPEEIKKMYGETLERVELIAKNADHHLTWVIRFLMWTCALSFGMIAWFATNFVSHNVMSRTLALFGIVLIMNAIVVGVYVINQVFTYWELTWRSTNTLYEASLELVGAGGKPEISGPIRDAVRSTKGIAMERNRWTKTFPVNQLVLIHLALLGSGIVIYSVTMFL